MFAPHTDVDSFGLHQVRLAKNLQLYCKRGNKSVTLLAWTYIFPRVNWAVQTNCNQDRPSEIWHNVFIVGVGGSGRGRVYRMQTCLGLRIGPMRLTSVVSVREAMRSWDYIMSIMDIGILVSVMMLLLMRLSVNTIGRVKVRKWLRLVWGRMR